MEDPVIEFFATALGLNPKKLELPVDTIISIESTIIPLTIEDLEKQNHNKVKVQQNQHSDIDKLADGQYFTQYYKKQKNVTCNYLFSREVDIDENLISKKLREQEENFSLHSFSLNGIRSLFEKPKMSGADPTLSAQRSALNVKEVGKKLSKLSVTSRGYSTLSDDQSKISDSSMYNDKQNRFDRRRNKFLSENPISQSSDGSKSHQISWSMSDDEFSEIDLQSTTNQQQNTDISAASEPNSPRVGKLLDLDFDENQASILEENDEFNEHLISAENKTGKFSGLNVSPNPQTSSSSSSLKKSTSSLKEYSPVIILHIHGGGWISQSPRTHLAYLRTWAKQTNLPILSVDYGTFLLLLFNIFLFLILFLGLSPENEFPSALNECFAAYTWLLDPNNAQSIGVPAFESSPRIILAGDSAGGNLCCALTTRVNNNNSLHLSILI